MNYDLIRNLLNLAEEFEKEHPGTAQTSDFAVWLYQKTAHQSQPVLISVAGSPVGETLESSIGKLITFMYRYAKSYTKKALEDSPLLTVDDFVYLITVFSLGSTTKMELIEKNIHEKATGMEVIRRLLQQEFIGQQDDEQDRRSKRVFITEKGKGVLFSILGKMSDVALLVSGGLSAEEKLHLSYLLNKLHDFHRPIFIKEKNSTFEQIGEKYIKKDEQAKN